MYCLDLKKKKISNPNKYQDLVFKIDVAHPSGKRIIGLRSFADAALEKLNDCTIFKTQPDLSYNIHFIVCAIEIQDEADFEVYVDTLLDSFVYWNIESTQRNGTEGINHYLDAPKELFPYINLARGQLKQMFNNDCKINRFTISIIDENDEYHYNMMNTKELIKRKKLPHAK